MEQRICKVGMILGSEDVPSLLSGPSVLVGESKLHRKAIFRPRHIRHEGTNAGGPSVGTRKSPAMTVSVLASASIG